MSSNDAVGELICPITGEVFLDPVLLVGDGHTYEREAAERWLAKHATSPLSGQPLPPHGLDLVPNHALRKQASALLERRPDLRPVPGAWCAKEDAKGAAGAGADASPSAPDLQGAGEGEEDEVGAAKRRAQAEAGFSSRVDASSDSPSAPPLFHGGGFLVGTRGGGALSFDLSTRARIRGGSGPLAPSSRREHVPFLAASDDGSVFASGISNSSTVHIWRPPTAIDAFPAAPIAVTARDWATCAAISRAGDWAVVAGRSERLDAYRVGDGGGGAGAGAVIVSSESLRADADAPWHKDFVTCVARDGDASVVYGAEDWTLPRRRRRRHSWRRRRRAHVRRHRRRRRARRGAHHRRRGRRTNLLLRRARGGRARARARTGRVGSPRDESRRRRRGEKRRVWIFRRDARRRASPRGSARVFPRARGRGWCGKDGECRRGGGGSRGIRSRGGDGRARTRRERTARRVVRVVGRRRGGGRRGRRVDRRRRAADVRRGVRGDATRRGDARGGGGRRKSSEKGVPLEMVRGVMARRRKSAKERDGEEQYL